MSCSNAITIVPSGCLDETILELACKTPGEIKPYSFSVANRMLPTDYIFNVAGQPAGESGVTVNNIITDGQTFECKISGGKINHDVGIRFVIHTKQKNIVEFDCRLPIRHAGILYQNGLSSQVLDATSPAGTISIGKVVTISPDQPASITNVGTSTAALLNFELPQGAQGTAATVKIGNVTTGESGSQAVVVNSGTTSNAILDFTLPTGKNGEIQTVKIGETKTLPAGHDATVEATMVNNVVTLTFGIPSGTTGEAGQYILNVGDVKTVGPNEQATASITSDGKGNHFLSLSIPQGRAGNDGISPTLSIGTVATYDPDQKATADIVHNSDGKDILNLGLVKGDKGDTGEQGIQGENGDIGPQGGIGPQGKSYTNDGTVSLNVKSALISGNNTALSISSIERDIDLTYSNPTRVGGQYYTPKFQDNLFGKNIAQIGLFTATEGVYTVSLIDRPDISKPVVNIIKTTSLNLKKDQQWYDLGWNIGQNQVLSFQFSKDTANTIYSSISSTNRQLFLTWTGTSWTDYEYDNGLSLANSDLNIGFKLDDSQNNEIFSNKKIVILGDSISSFKNFTVNQNYNSYPKADIKTYHQTWMSKFIQKAGGNLIYNDSRGSSGVTTNGTVPENSLTNRTSIPDFTDVCFIFMGINDFNGGTTAKLGNFDPNKTTFDTTIFSDAMCVSIINLKKSAPNCNFVWITPLRRFNGSKEVQSSEGYSLDVWTERIIEICTYYGIHYIDTRSIGINVSNQTEYFSDGVHPSNEKATQLVADYIYKSFNIQNAALFVKGNVSFDEQNITSDGKGNLKTNSLMTKEINLSAIISLGDVENSNKDTDLNNGSLGLLKGGNIGNYDETLKSFNIIPTVTVAGIINIASSNAGVSPVFSLKESYEHVGIDGLVLNANPQVLNIVSNQFLGKDGTFYQGNYFIIKLLLIPNVNVNYAAYECRYGNGDVRSNFISLKLYNTASGKYVDFLNDQTIDFQIMIVNFKL